MKTLRPNNREFCVLVTPLCMYIKTRWHMPPSAHAWKFVPWPVAVPWKSWFHSVSLIPGLRLQLITFSHLITHCATQCECTQTYGSTHQLCMWIRIYCIQSTIRAQTLLSPDFLNYGHLLCGLSWQLCDSRWSNIDTLWITIIMIRKHQK